MRPAPSEEAPGVAGVRLRTPEQRPGDRGPKTDPSHPDDHDRAQEILLIRIRPGRRMLRGLPFGAKRSGRGRLPCGGLHSSDFPQTWRSSNCPESSNEPRPTRPSGKVLSWAVMAGVVMSSK